MEKSICTFFVVFAILSSAFGQKDFKDDGNSTEEVTETNPSKSTPDSRHLSKSPILINPRLYRPPAQQNKQYKNRYFVETDDDVVHDTPSRERIPNYGHPVFKATGQNLYVVDGNGKYNVRLESLPPPNTPDFNTAIGAISSHILKQKTSQEYIPYPPNGNPYSYPAYRGNPRATEPPVVGVYEQASNSHYQSRPPSSFEQYYSRRSHDGSSRSHPRKFRESDFNDERYDHSSEPFQSSSYRDRKNAELIERGRRLIEREKFPVEPFY